jgi:ketosteroid isomerase-like protein
MMSLSLESRIQLLEDREQIRELRATYCFLVDDGRFEELVESCFTQDAVCDFRYRQGLAEPLVFSGRPGILVFYRDMVAKTLVDMSHTVQNHRIQVNGDQGTGDCYFELTARDASSGAAMTGAGRYLDCYQRVQGVWQIAERNADIFYIVPLASGW